MAGSTPGPINAARNSPAFGSSYDKYRADGPVAQLDRAADF